MKSDKYIQYYQEFSVQNGRKSTAICLPFILIPFNSVNNDNNYKKTFYWLKTTIMKEKIKKEEAEELEEKVAILELIKQ